MFFEAACKQYYSEKVGAPAKPIRLVVSLLILKYVRNLSDENMVEQWAENCYYQYPSGEQIFQPAIPCVPTESVAFRKRIGEAGMGLILKESTRASRPKKGDRFFQSVCLKWLVRHQATGSLATLSVFVTSLTVIANRASASSDLYDLYAMKQPLSCEVPFQKRKSFT